MIIVEIDGGLVQSVSVIGGTGRYVVLDRDIDGCEDCCGVGDTEAAATPSYAVGVPQDDPRLPGLARMLADAGDRDGLADLDV